MHAIELGARIAFELKDWNLAIGFISNVFKFVSLKVAVKFKEQIYWFFFVDSVSTLMTFRLPSPWNRAKQTRGSMRYKFIQKHLLFT